MEYLFVLATEELQFQKMQNFIRWYNQTCPNFSPEVDINFIIVASKQISLHYLLFHYLCLSGQFTLQATLKYSLEQKHQCFCLQVVYRHKGSIKKNCLPKDGVLKTFLEWINNRNFWFYFSCYLTCFSLLN